MSHSKFDALHCYSHALTSKNTSLLRVYHILQRDPTYDFFEYQMERLGNYQCIDRIENYTNVVTIVPTMYKLKLSEYELAQE